MTIETAEHSHELAAACERRTGYHDPESIEPEAPATIESRYGFAVIVNGHPQHKTTFEQFAVGVVNAYATVDSDVAVGIVTDETGSIRELTEAERHQLLDFAVALVLA